MSSVVIFLEHGFEEVEFCAPVDVLRRLGVSVTIAGVSALNVKGSHGITIQADCLLSKLISENFDALILPGGAASWTLRDNPAVIRWIRDMHQQNKLIAAICAAPIALAKAGIITSKRLTAFPAPDVLKSLTEAHYTGTRIEVDGKLITAQGAGCALDFGYSIGRFFCSEGDVTAVETAMIHLK